MDLFEQAIARGRAGRPSIEPDFLRSLMRKRAGQLTKREDLLAQPDALERRVAAHAQMFSLAAKKPRTKRSETRLSALERQAEGTPQEGFASELLAEYTAALDNPEYINLSNRQLLGRVSAALMRRSDKEDKTRWERAYRYKWRADTDIGNLFGIFGEDESVRKLPGYEQYLERQKALPVEEWHTGPGEAAAIGAGFTTALIMGSRVIGRAAMFAPLPGARIAGAAMMAIPEFMAFDAIHNVIAKTEWGRAREGTWRKIGVDLLVGGALVGGGAATARLAVRKAAEKLVISKQATDMLVKSGFMSGKAVAAREAKVVAAKAQALADQAIVRNISKEDVLSEVANLSKVLENIGAEKRFATELARPMIPRMPGPGIGFVEPLKEVKAKTGTKAAVLVKSILEAQGGKPAVEVTTKNVGKKFAELSELRADMALRKTQKTKDVKAAIAEQKRVQELAREQERAERIVVAQAKGKKVRADTEKQVAVAKKAEIEKRVEQRKKLKAQKVVQEAWDEDLKMLELEGRAGVLEGKLAGLTAKDIPEKSVATFRAFQEVPGKPAVAYYDVVGGKLHGSTVTKTSLKSEGIKIPKTPKAEAAKTMTKAERLKLLEERGKLKEQEELKSMTKELEEAKAEVGKETKEMFVSLEEAGFVETYKGGVEEDLAGGMEKSGKDLVDLMDDSWKLFGIGVLGFGSVLLADLLNPKEVEANPGLIKAAVSVPKMMARTIGKAVEGAKKPAEKVFWEHAKEWFEGKLLHIDIPEGSKEVLYNQEALGLAPLAAEKYGDLVKNLTGKSVPKWLTKISSPYWPGSELYKMNPIAEIGNRQAVIGGEVKNYLKATLNIFDDVPGLQKNAGKTTKEIMDTMEALAIKYSTEVPAYRAVDYELRTLGELFEKLHKALGAEKGVALKKDERRIISEFLGKKKGLRGRLKAPVHKRAMDEIEKRMASWKVAEEELRPAFEAFEKEHLTIMELLARKHPTARIALACEDTEAYIKFPFLKSIMTPEEKEATIWLKKMHEGYKARMVASGHDVIEGPYIHHAWHPKWNETAAAKRLEDFGLNSNGVPFSKFHRRARFSKQMVPDIYYIMPRYTMDTERRIQWSGFWGVGKKDSWYAHRRWVNQYGTENLKLFWDKIKASTIPSAHTKTNEWANIYTSFEVARLLAFSGSVPLKHYFKVMGSMATMGVGSFVSHYTTAMEQGFKSLKNAPEVLSIARKAGIKIPETPEGKKKVINEVINSFITQQHTMNTIADLDFESLIPQTAGFRQFVIKKLQSFNRWGSIPIRAIEALDRHHTVLMGWHMAAKKGMTAKDAFHSIYSNILKVNFLSGAANPAWVRNPKIRAALLFQNTVFKIFERRLWTAWRAGGDVYNAARVTGYQVKAWKGGKALNTPIGMVKPEDIGNILKEIKEIGKLIFTSEKELKQHMIYDALTATRDEFGASAIKQTMREIVLSVGVLIGGGAIGLNLMPQVWHVPLVKHGAKAPTLAINPFINAAFRTAGERGEAVEYDEEQDFLVTQFLKNWLKSTGYIPQTLNKMMRITKNDIPEIYKGSKWQYFFSVPEEGEHF